VVACAAERTRACESEALQWLREAAQAPDAAMVPGHDEDNRPALSSCLVGFCPQTRI
jgi:hypothetical protein